MLIEIAELIVHNQTIVEEKTSVCKIKTLSTK